MGLWEPSGPKRRDAMGEAKPPTVGAGGLSWRSALQPSQRFVLQVDAALSPTWGCQTGDLTLWPPPALALVPVLVVVAASSAGLPAVWGSK